jgi:hypothetical protein
MSINNSIKILKRFFDNHIRQAVYLFMVIDFFSSMFLHYIFINSKIKLNLIGNTKHILQSERNIKLIIYNGQKYNWYPKNAKWFWGLKFSLLLPIKLLIFNSAEAKGVAINLFTLFLYWVCRFFYGFSSVLLFI